MQATREQVRDEILRLGAVPLLIDDDSSTDDNVLQPSYNKIQAADVFVDIYASYYGETPGSGVVYQRVDHATASGDGKTSIPHWEYLWATERGLPILLFMMSKTDESDQPANRPPEYIEDEPDKSRLLEFKRLIMNTHKVSLFHSPDHLARQLDPVMNFLSVYGIRPDMQNGTCRGRMHTFGDFVRALTIIPSQSNGPKPSCKGTMHRAPAPAPIFTGEWLSNRHTCAPKRSKCITSL